MTVATTHTRTLFSMALLTLVCAAPAPGSDTAAQDAALRAYFSANGLLNRGLYDLAANEYGRFLAACPDHEKVPVAQYGRAVCLVHLGRHDEAARLLDPLAQRTDFQYASEVGVLLGQCRLAGGDYAPAAKACLQVLRAHAEHDLADDAAAIAIEALYRAGDAAATLKLCNAFNERWPANPLAERADYYGALAALQQNDHRDAAQRLERLVSHFAAGPFANHARLLLGQCAQHAGAPQQAAHWYQQVLDQADSPYQGDALLGLAIVKHSEAQYDEAARLLDRLLASEPNGELASAARLLRGRIYFEQSDFARAQALCEQVLANDETRAAEATYWAARCALRLDQPRAALDRLTDAVPRFADSEFGPLLHYDRIVALTQLGELAEALSAIESFRTRYPEHALAAQALHLAAVNAHNQQKYADSRKHCAAFLKQYPNHELATDIAYLLAENAYLAGEYADALEAYTQFERAHPQDDRAAQVAYRIGMAHYRLDQQDAALKRLAALPTAQLEEPPFRPALLALGDLHFNRSEWTEAERYLSAYVGDGIGAPAADDALIKLGVAQQRQGHHEAALQTLDRLNEQFPDSSHYTHALFERGQALLTLNRTDEAAAAFEQVLAADDSSPLLAHVHNHLGLIAMQRGRYADAADHFASVLAADPDESLAAEAYYQQGQALLLAERYEEAERALATFAKKHDQHPQVPAARAQRAIAQARLAQCDDALNSINGLERDGLAALPPTLQAALRHEQAWCLRKLERPADAADVYRKLLASGGDTPDVRAAVELAEIEAAAGRHAEAADLLRPVRDAAKREASAVPADVLEGASYRLGVCALELRRNAEAAEVLAEFLTAFPESKLAASADYFCGEACYRDGRHEAAAARFAHLVEHFPADPLLGPSLLRLGDACAALQLWARSEAAFGDYLARFPEGEQWFQARFGVGWACENQGRHAEAIQAYQDIVAKHQGPTAARAQFQIGECLFAQKKLSEAVRELLKVDILYAYPEWSAAALYEAGRCLEAQGQIVEARGQFKTVVERYQESRWAGLAQERLKATADAVLPGQGS